LVLAGISKERSITYLCESDYSYEAYKENNYEAQKCGNSIIANFYFVSYLIIVNMMLLNLFIAVVLEGFEVSSLMES